MDHEITTLQALSLWWQHGEIPKGFVLWGQYLFFWDRLGKILEIVGALAVVIDVLGAERLAAIAAGLRQWSQDPETRPLTFVIRPRVVLTGVVSISILAGIALLTGPQKVDPVLPFTGIHLPASLAVATTSAGLALAAYVFLALYFVLFEAVTPPIADYTARLLQREHADKWLKLISLPLLSLGFFLDLLAA
jgi:hypothetical protein